MDFSAFRDMKPFSQFMFAIFVMVASLFIFMIAGLVAAIPVYGGDGLLRIMTEMNQADKPLDVNFLKYLQILQSVGLFVVPPFILGWLYHGKVSEYLLIDRTTKGQSYFLAIASLLAIVPCINLLGDLNSRMSLPESLSGLETWMKNSEENAKMLVEKFMAVEGIPGLLFNVFMIAIIPAIGEEFLFRGVIQRIFTGWTRNHHLGIWITAFLFSAMHLQFYGFLPRMILGAMFGYILVWTGTMWVPVLAHFINNLMGVIGYFLMGKGTISKDIEEWGTDPGQLPLVVVSVLLVGGLLFLLYRGERDKTKMPVNQKDSQA